MKIQTFTFRSTDMQFGTVSRFGSKLKGAIRGAIDGSTLEATEVPTVWDAFTDEPQVTKTNKLFLLKDFSFKEFLFHRQTIQTLEIQRFTIR